jgi:FG-GAP-like repeat
MRRFLACLSLPFALLCTAPLGFGAPVSFSASTLPAATGGPPVYYHAELNNDGREDLLYIPNTYYGQVGYFVVQLSNGDGTYATLRAYDLPNSPGIFEIATADFTGDGNTDVAIFATDNNLYLFRNTGNGTLTPNGTFAFASGNLGNANARVGDYNHDGKQDLVSAFFTVTTPVTF